MGHRPRAVPPQPEWAERVSKEPAVVDRYYVVTDVTGRARNGEIERHFELREGAGPDEGGPVALVDVTTLLTCLDEVIFEAEPIGATSEASPGTWHADDARLLRRTPWDARSAASFALSCVEHVIGDDRDIEIPGGQTLGAVLDDAKRFLEESGGEREGRLAKLSRLATARRLHRSGEHIGDLARGRLGEDLADEITITSDPDWTLLASSVDAVLAVVEALRHVALPNYVSDQEEAGGARDTSDGESFIPSFWPSPWGNFATGAEHEPTYLPTSRLAREAALRARETVTDRAGEAAGTAETAWQVALLESVLENR
jgi:hypothetical protein